MTYKILNNQQPYEGFFFFLGVNVENNDLLRVDYDRTKTFQSPSLAKIKQKSTSYGINSNIWFLT